ncbi:MAG: Rieske 2Fe-2S domain-containing protein [Kangiellaceae bacterium]|jgi:nitrite reductase/ring-hydroxylating ferredoxin subunit|nr:Rieske 2Fe-2S domain-containing protein [Kangiellaceae bacterium]
MELLCQLDELASKKAKLISREKADDTIVIKLGEIVSVFVNNCPHANARLNLGHDKIIAFDDYHLLCSVHGAQFNPESGICTLGPCKGQSLVKLNVEVIDGGIYLSDS